MSFFFSVVHQLQSWLNRSEVNEFRILLQRSREQMKIANAGDLITVRYSSELSVCICPTPAMPNSNPLIAYIKNNVFYEYYRPQTPQTAWRGRDRLIPYLAVLTVKLTQQSRRSPTSVAKYSAGHYRLFISSRIWVRPNSDGVYIFNQPSPCTAL